MDANFVSDLCVVDIGIAGGCTQAGTCRYSLVPAALRCSWPSAGANFGHEFASVYIPQPPPQPHLTEFAFSL